MIAGDQISLKDQAKAVIIKDIYLFYVLTIKKQKPYCIF